MPKHIQHTYTVIFFRSARQAMQPVTAGIIPEIILISKQKNDAKRRPSRY